MTIVIPQSAAEFTPDLFTKVARQLYPDLTVTNAKLIKVHAYGEGNVSTTERATFELEYGPGAPDLPKRVMLKLSLGSPDQDPDAWYLQLYALFRNEVNFYNGIRPELEIEAPRTLGGYFDPETKQYLLVLEDLSERNASFPTMLDVVEVSDVQHVLDTYAKLHATFWDSSRFSQDLSWVETHLEGGVETLMRSAIPVGIRNELSLHKFKRETLEWLGTTEPQLFAGMCALKAHQATLPQTLLHGDSHLMNTYRLPDGTGGLHDWQLCVRGYALNDVSYFITTALSIELRRKHERELLRYYREKLLSFGVASPPDEETLWNEHRRATHWSLYNGWIPCPAESYGWDLLATAMQRVAVAFSDHDTHRLVAQIS